MENLSTEQATNIGIKAFPIKHWNLMTYLLLCPPQAAINAMNLEQQLSQYTFFSQQPSSQNHQSQQVSIPPAQKLELHSQIFLLLGILAQREENKMSMYLGLKHQVSYSFLNQKHTFGLVHLKT